MPNLCLCLKCNLSNTSCGLLSLLCRSVTRERQRSPSLRCDSNIAFDGPGGLARRQRFRTGIDTWHASRSASATTLGPECSRQCQCSSCVPELRSQVAVRDLFKVEQTRVSIRFCHSTARHIQRWRLLACFRVAAIALRCLPVAGSRARLFFSCEHLRHKTPSWNSIVARQFGRNWSQTLNQQ